MEELRMNFSLAFFHGEQFLVGMAVAGLIVVITAPLVFYIWWHTKSSERTLTLTYVIAVAVCVLNAIPTDNPSSLFQFTMFTVAGILALPWNLITIVAIDITNNSYVSDRESMVATLLGAGVNAVIIFYGAKRLRRWKG